MGWPGPITHRQFTVWGAWLASSMNRPGRADFYAMQIAAELRRARVKDASDVQIDQFRIKFETAAEKPRKIARTPEEEMAASKATWLGGFGIKRKADG